MNEMQAVAIKACSILDDKLGTDIVCLDIAKMTIISDYFVICSGRSAQHVKALYDELEVKMEELGYPLIRAEGYSDGRWVVMDFSIVIVHIFNQPEREFHHLERLWDDGSNRIPFEETK